MSLWEWQMAVNHGVTARLVLPSVSSLTRAGISAISGAVFRTIIHLKALREPRASSMPKASPFSCSCPTRGHSEDAVLGQWGPPPLFRVEAKGSPRAHRSTSGSPRIAINLVAVLLAIGVTSGLFKAGGEGDLTQEVISAWGGPLNTVDIAGSLPYAAIGAS